MELRVFISSTFRDLQEEREYLSKKVFPAIRKLCRDRGVEFTEIDLRWGLTHEEAKNGRIIRTCLEEIDKCRPYFIGIMGSRYGWVPQFHEVQRDPDLVRNHPWVEDLIADGASILEIEFEYAALRDPLHTEFANFYARKQHINHQLPYEVDLSDNHERLEALKEKVRASGLPLHEFTGAESLGDHIYHDLVAIINSNWKASEEVSPLDHERRRHEAFASSRRHAYIASPKYVKVLNEYSQTDGNPIVIFAASGSGKSALLSYWIHQYKERHPNDFVIQHFVGIGTSAGDEKGILSHIMAEIKARYGLTEELPTQPEKIVTDFPLWLARVQNERLVVAIDALNQLEDRAHNLEWLPHHIPANIKFITSTTSEVMVRKLESRSWRSLPLAPLTIDEREAIIVRFLSEYHKGLSLEQSSRIAKDRKSASPLFLRTLLEELRLFGSFEHLEQNIDSYLACDGLDDLFQLVLERMEDDYGARTVREVMSLICASRKGLSERELADLIPITRMRLSAFLIALDYHLHRRDGLLTFFHDYLRSAVEKRYLSSPAKAKKAHFNIGDYMSKQVASARRADEEPWQWEQSEEWEKLKNSLTDIPRFEILSEKERQYELLAYWRKLEGKFDLRAEYSKALRDYEKSFPIDENSAKIYLQLANFYLIAGRFVEAKTFFERSIEICKRIFGVESDQLSQSLDDYATLLYHKGDLELAEDYFLQALAIRAKLFGEEGTRYIKTLGNLGAVYFGKGELERASETFEKSISVAETGIGHYCYEVGSNLHNLGMVLFQEGKFAEAIVKFETALEVLTEVEGDHHPDIVGMLEGIGRSYGGLEEYSKGEKYLRSALELSTNLMGDHHPFTLMKMNNLAVLLRRANRLDEAEDYFLRAVELGEYCESEDSTALSRVYNLADFYRTWKNDFKKAMPFYKKAADLQSRFPSGTTGISADLQKLYAQLLAEHGIKSENTRSDVIEQ